MPAFNVVNSASAIADGVHEAASVEPVPACGIVAVVRVGANLYLDAVALIERASLHVEEPLLRVGATGTNQKQWRLAGVQDEQLIIQVSEPDVFLFPRNQVRVV